MAKDRRPAAGGPFDEKQRRRISELRWARSLALRESGNRNRLELLERYQRAMLDLVALGDAVYDELDVIEDELHDEGVTLREALAEEGRSVAEAISHHKDLSPLGTEHDLRATTAAILVERGVGRGITAYRAIRDVYGLGPDEVGNSAARKAVEAAIDGRQSMEKPRSR